MFSTAPLHPTSEWRAWANSVFDAEWGGVVARGGELVDPNSLDGVVALRDGVPVGVVTYRPTVATWEVVTLNAIERRRGIGRALVSAVVERATRAGAESIGLVTTNDNLDAIAFYEAMGFERVRTDTGAVDAARRELKPSIPMYAANGIPIRDELEYRRSLRAP